MSHGLAIVFCDDANPVVELDAVVAALRQRWPSAALWKWQPASPPSPIPNPTST